MKGAQRVLLVEDEEFVRESVVAVLAEGGFEVCPAEDVDTALELLAREPIDLVLTDLRLPGRGGMDLVTDQAVAASRAPVIVLTGHGTVDDAVEAMRAGAFDFLQKPVEPDRLLLCVRRALEHGRLLGEVDRLRNVVARGLGERSLVGDSASMEQVRTLIQQVAATDVTVLVCGESGTGKELVANELHLRSPRADGPLVLVNCAAVPPALFESEFFGHRRGAFSGAYADRTGRFAEASGGTLVLDEIHTLPGEVQAKLLRVLETGEYQMVGESRTRVVDVRIVAVTNADLPALVDEGNFRSDLYFRLDVFPIRVPPLREHPEDVETIARELMSRARRSAGVGLLPVDGLEDEAVEVLRSYEWLGNVRELRNVLERAAILAMPNGRITAELVRGLLGASGSSAPRAEAEDGDLDLKRSVERAERHAIEQALRASGGSKKDAAKQLGIDPKNLSYYLRKHGISDDAS